MTPRSALVERRLYFGFSQQQLADKAASMGMPLAAFTILRAEQGQVVRPLTASRLMKVLEVEQERWHEFFPEIFRRKEEVSA